MDDGQLTCAQHLGFQREEVLTKHAILDMVRVRILPSKIVLKLNKVHILFKKNTFFSIKNTLLAQPKHLVSSVRQDPSRSAQRILLTTILSHLNVKRNGVVVNCRSKKLINISNYENTTNSLYLHHYTAQHL